jgi:cell wall-associated NlpC family hydrolase
LTRAVVGAALTTAALFAGYSSAPTASAQPARPQTIPGAAISPTAELTPLATTAAPGHISLPTAVPGAAHFTLPIASLTEHPVVRDTAFVVKRPATPRQVPESTSPGRRALAAALAEKGTPYVWGGTSTSGFDCSGLMQWSFKKAGVNLPRTSQAQSTVGRPVAKSDLQPGDLVFFYSSVHHVGIYVGNGKVLHAPEPGEVVKISPLNAMPFHNARRI